MSEFNPEQALARSIKLEERRDAEFRQLPDFERRVARGDYEFFSSVDIELRELEQEAQWNGFVLEGKWDGQHLVYTIEQMSPGDHAEISSAGSASKRKGSGKANSGFPSLKPSAVAWGVSG